jgi:AcrR family transcriptional regulator
VYLQCKLDFIGNKNKSSAPSRQGSQVGSTKTPSRFSWRFQKILGVLCALTVITDNVYLIPGENMSPRPKRIDQHPNLEEAIKEIAWRQIAGFGAPALSLRAIARELNITAPAIYNYFLRRDDLVTALIVDAFNSLGEAQKDSIRDLPEDDLATRLSTLGLAYRSWAIAYPQRYRLIFGTPIPGYEAPADITVLAAAWSLVPLIETLQAIYLAGRLRVEQFAEMTSELKSMLEAWGQFTGGINVEVLYTALVIWGRAHGLVTLEIGNQMPSFITDPGEIYRREIKTIENQLLRE